MSSWLNYSWWDIHSKNQCQRLLSDAFRMLENWPLSHSFIFKTFAYFCSICLCESQQSIISGQETFSCNVWIGIKEQRQLQYKQVCHISCRNWSETVHLMLARAGSFLEKELPWNKLKNELWGLVFNISAHSTCVSEVISGFWGVTALATPIPKLISNLTLPGKVSLDKDTEYKQD